MALRKNQNNKYSSLYAPDGMTNDTMSNYRSTMSNLNNTWGGDILGYQNTDAFKGLNSSQQNQYYNDRTYFNDLYGNVSAYDTEWKQEQDNLRRQQEYANTRRMLMQRYMPETLSAMGYANTGAAGDALLKLNNNYDNYAMNAQQTAQNNQSALFSMYNPALQSIEQGKIAEEQEKLKLINQTKSDMANNLGTYTDSFIDSKGYDAGLTPEQIQELKDYRDSLKGVGTKGSGYNADVAINTQAKAFTPDNAAGYILQNMGQPVSTAGKNRQLKFIQKIIDASKNGQIKDGTLIDFNYGLSTSQNKAGTVYIWDEGSGQWLQTSLSRKQAAEYFPNDFYTGDLFGAKGWTWNKLNPFDEEGKSFYTDYDYNAAMEETPEEEAVEAAAFNMEDEEVSTNTTSGKKSDGKTGAKANANKGGEVVTSGTESSETADPLQYWKTQMTSKTTDKRIEEWVNRGEITEDDARELKRYRNEELNGITYVGDIKAYKDESKTIYPTDTVDVVYGGGSWGGNGKLGQEVAVGFKNKQKTYIEDILKLSREHPEQIDVGTLVDFNYGLSLSENKAGTVYVWDGEKWLQTTLSRNAAHKLAKSNDKYHFYTGDRYGMRGTIKTTGFNKHSTGNIGNPFDEEGESFYNKYYPYQGVEKKASDITYAKDSPRPKPSDVYNALGLDVQQSKAQADYLNRIWDAIDEGAIKDGDLIDFNYGASIRKNRQGTIYRWNEKTRTFIPTIYSRNSAAEGMRKGEQLYTGDFFDNFGKARWINQAFLPTLAYFTARGDSLHNAVKDFYNKVGKNK